MRVWGLFVLLLGMWVAVAHFERRAADLHRRHMKLATMPVRVFSDHWYMGADGRPHPRPGHGRAYAYEEGDGESGTGALAEAVAPRSLRRVVTTAPSVSSNPPG